jgi:hypothetical protein
MSVCFATRAPHNKGAGRGMQQGQRPLPALALGANMAPKCAHSKNIIIHPRVCTFGVPVFSQPKLAPEGPRGIQNWDETSPREPQSEKTGTLFNLRLVSVCFLSDQVLHSLEGSAVFGLVLPAGSTEGCRGFASINNACVSACACVSVH